MSMRDTYPEPTEYDLAMQELYFNVKYLKEQLAEAVRLLNESGKFVSMFLEYSDKSTEMLNTLAKDAVAFLAQNSEASQ